MSQIVLRLESWTKPIRSALLRFPQTLFRGARLRSAAPVSWRFLGKPFPAILGQKNPHARGQTLLRHLALCSFALLYFEFAANAQTPQTLSVPADSPRWNLEAEAKVADYLGRKSIFLDGGAAVLKDFEMRDGVIDVDVATPAMRGFFGVQFRITADG